jgi:hypothetical protein
LSPCKRIFTSFKYGYSNWPGKPYGIHMTEVWHCVVWLCLWTRSKHPVCFHIWHRCQSGYSPRRHQSCKHNIE